jgi:hypothetical protein
MSFCARKISQEPEKDLARPKKEQTFELTEGLGNKCRK